MFRMCLVCVAGVWFVLCFVFWVCFLCVPAVDLPFSLDQIFHRQRGSPFYLRESLCRREEELRVPRISLF